MIFSLLRKNAESDAAFAVYSAIVAQSRQPRFYADWEIPDTVTGRFDMICLHLAMMFRRLRADGPRGADLSQAVFDLFFKDMDRSLRELGVGDLSVPKKIEKMGSVFYGLLAALDEPLERRDAKAIAAVLVRNVYDNREAAVAAALSQYLLSEADRLAALPLAEITAGRLAVEGGA